MAIAEFGRSLLGDVRARKDQQADDARKYARKQAKKELNLAGAAFLGGQFFKAATSNLQTKTNAFLANSDLNKRKIDMQQAEKKHLKLLLTLIMLKNLIFLCTIFHCRTQQMLP